MPPRQPVDRKLCQLECDIMDTLKAGLQRSRSDLSYPESASDMTWAIQALMEMFKIERRPVPLRIRWTHEEPRWCDSCRAICRNKYGECTGCNSTVYDDVERLPVGECAVCPPGQKLSRDALNLHKCDECKSEYEPTGRRPILKRRGK